jgi:hypothetical protein
MPVTGWLIFGSLWWATLTSFRRDPFWDLWTEGAIFLLFTLSLFSDRRTRAWKLALGLAAIGTLGAGQLILGETISPASTALSAMRWMACAAWCLAVQRELSDSRDRFLEHAVHGAGAFAVLSLVMWWTSSGHVYWRWPTTQDRVLGPWVNRNHFAVWCELLLAPAVWLAAQQKQFWWAAAAILAGAAATRSRAGMGLIVFEVLVLIVALGWRRPAKARLAIGLLVFPVAAALFGGEDLWRKLHDPEPLLYRDQMWRSSLTLWQARPWFGHGLGTFEKAYPETATFDTGELVDHAHNDWLEWGVEGGWALMAIALAGFACSVRLSISAPWVAGVPIAGLHALVDYPFARFPLFLWVILLLTLASLQRARSKMKQPTVSGRTNRLAPRKKGVLNPHRIPG